MCLALLDELLDEDVGNAEGGPGLAPRLVEGGVERVGRLDHAHAAAAAAHRRLDDHRVAERRGNRLGLVARHDRRVAAGEHRHARFARQLARGHLVSQQVEQLGPRPDESDPRAGAGPGELGVFRQEAVTGMNRVDLLRPGQLDDRLDVQIAADRLAGLADLVGLVGLERWLANRSSWE